MQKCKSCEITAIASRDLEKARAAAKKLGIPKAYGSYDELLADKEIDAIYNPLPTTCTFPGRSSAWRLESTFFAKSPSALIRRMQPRF